MHPLLETQEKKRQKRIQSFGKIGAVILLISTIPDIYFQQWKTVGISFFTILVFVVILWQNHKNKIKHIGSILSFITNCGIFIACISLGDLSRAYLFYIPLFITTFLIIDYRNRFVLFFNLAHIVLGIFLIDIFDLTYFLDNTLTPEVVHSYGKFNTFLALTASIYFLMAFVKEISDNERNFFMIQETFKAKNDELTKRNDELDRLIYSISHDIKSPLASITGLIYIAKLENNQPVLDEYFDRLDLSIKKLKVFLDNIINYYKNTKFEIQSEKIYFEDEIKNLLENFTYHPNFKEIKINLVCNQDEAFIGDRLRIQTILLNLLSNAVKYQNENEKNKRIDIQIKTFTDKVQIEVSDNGIGIDDNSKHRIFEMFYRGTVKSDGSGLGLYILNETITKLNGKVNIDSKKDKYTKFLIEIPENAAINNQNTQSKNSL